MAIFEQTACIREKVVVFWQSDRDWAKVDIFGQSGCILEKWLYSLKVVVFAQKWLYSGKSCCIQEKKVAFGQSGCISAKVVVFGQK